MVASLKIIDESETNIEFTSEEVAALKMPGISLGHLVLFRDKMEKMFGLEHLPTQYKEGFVDRIFEAHYAIKLLLKGIEDNVHCVDSQKQIWTWIWHILKDEYKVNSYEVNLLTGEINIDIDNAVSSNTD